MENKERGYTFCKNGKPRKGLEVTGDAHSVAIPISCPVGSKPVALVHTHPSGSLQLSPQDIKTMREKGLPVCVRAGNKIRCYRPKK